MPRVGRGVRTALRAESYSGCHAACPRPFERSVRRRHGPSCPGPRGPLRRLLPDLHPLAPAVAEKPARGRACGRRRPARAGLWKGGRPNLRADRHHCCQQRAGGPGRRPTRQADRDAPPPAPPRPVRLAAAGLALDRGTRAMALRDLRADRLRPGR